MLDPGEKKEVNNMKAIFIGLFLIILIATITIFKSNSEKEPLSIANDELPQTETIDSTKVKKITSEELAKKIQLGTDLVLIDLRNENQYQAEHIIDSINFSTSFSGTMAKNKPYVLIDEAGLASTINVFAQVLSTNGYADISYLEGGFASWKSKFNPTISDGDQKSFTDQAKVKYITSDDLKKLIEKEKNLTIIDVRKNTEFSTGHLTGAINIFLDDLESKRREIPLGKNIILYDNTLVGAFKGAVRLFDLGFSNALVLSDGLDNWKKKGYEIIK